MEEFVPQRTSSYISQYDLHIGEMTVRETLAFSARCQGVGPRYGQLNHCELWHLLDLKIFGCHITEYCPKWADTLVELSRREKAANIKPDPDIDIYMKVRQQLRENSKLFSVFILFFLY